VIQSRNDRLNAKTTNTNQTPPVANQDHWYVAYGFYLCDKFAPAITDQANPHGIHSTGDGIIHVEPKDNSVSGNNAVLGAFTAAVHVTLNAAELKLPGGHDYHDGDSCGGKAGRVRVRIFNSPSDKTGHDATLDPRKVPLYDQGLLTVAFAPAGAKLPPPPSLSGLAKFVTTTTTLPTTTTTAKSATTKSTTTTTPKSSTTLPATTLPATTLPATTTTTTKK
jgi:hypothetical protein